MRLVQSDARLAGGPGSARRMACILTLYDAGPSRLLPAPSRMTPPAVSVLMSARNGAPCVRGPVRSGFAGPRVTGLMPPAGVAR